MSRSVLRQVGPAAGLLLLATLGLPKTALGLDPSRQLTQYVHRIWQSQQGLPQGAILQVFQTREGFLWLGTQTGLVRFDGVRFQQAEDIIPGAPPNLWVRAALEDQKGRLWIGSNDSGVYRLGPDGVKQYTTAQGLPSNVIQCLAPGRDGVVWVCTENGLASIDVSGEPRIHASGDDDFTMNTQNVRAACVDPQGTYWIGGDRSAVQHNRSMTSLKGIPASASVRAMLCVGDTVWVGTSDGLIRIRGSEQRLFSVKDGLADNFVFSLAQGASQTIWIGTRNGFNRLRNEKLESFRPQDGLSQSTALAVYEDREGTLWVGTKRGLNQFVDGRGVPYTVSEGLPSNEAGPVLEDRAGVVWAGTLDRGLARFDGQEFRSLTTRDRLASNTVLALAEDRDGSLWAGTQAGLNQLRGGRVVETYTVQRGLPSNSIRSLYQDRAGTLWAGTQKGLARFHGGRFEVAPGSPQGLVVALSEDREGHLVLATERGVYESVSGEFREIKFNGSAIQPVNTLYRDTDGLLWMGLNGGGLRLWNSSPKGPEITSFVARDGLYDGEIYGIAEDDQDRLWMACSRGIFAVPRSELRRFAAGELKKITSAAYSPMDAQRVIEGQSGVAPVLSRAHDGRLWFSTIRGLLALDPSHWQRETTPPLVVIENPIVNGRSVPPDRIEQLPPGQNNLEFNYAGLAYYLPTRLRFRYMLEGFDRNWIDAGIRREAFYTNLPPGSFRFRVTACNADNVCTEQGATVEFSLAPHFYQRAWFWPLVAAAIAGLGWLVYQLRIRRLRERYDLILAERSRIARELHDTLIQGFSGITMAMQALAGRLRSSPRERETLEDIIRDAATCLRETRQSVAGLRAGHDAESGLNAALTAAAREITDTKDVRLKLKLDKGVPKLPAEVEYNLLRIASEAVSNSVKHSGARNIEVVLESTPEILRLQVHDDGSGLGKDGAALRPGHYGIIGMKERATQIGAELELLSEPGHGTTVSVRLPAGRAAQPEKVEALQ